MNNANDTAYNKERGRIFEDQSKPLPLRYDSDPVQGEYVKQIADAKAKLAKEGK